MSTVPTKHALPPLIELAEANELRIYTDVPVTGPEAGGWAVDGYSRIVHIGVSGVGPGGVEAFDRDQLAHALEVAPAGRGGAMVLVPRACGEALTSALAGTLSRSWIGSDGIGITMKDCS